VGALELAHREADVAVARAAAAEGVPMIFSNQASRPMEACVEAMGDAPRWFQLYTSTSDELVASLLGRAEACGCEAIVVTLDTPTLGWRPRDLANAYLPFIRGEGCAQFFSDPAFLAKLEQPPEADPLAAAAAMLMTFPNLGLRWEDLEWLRERVSVPLLVEGILRADDAELARAHGVDGIVVSNHGGRQVDGAIATLDALRPVVEAVGARMPVLLDSGVRGGADVFKALALGARAVLVGRTYAFALAVAGEEGVRETIRNLVAEFDLTLGLAGCASLAELGPERLDEVG